MMTLDFTSAHAWRVAAPRAHSVDGKRFHRSPIQIRKAADIWRQQLERNVPSGSGKHSLRRRTKMSKILSTAIVAGLLFGVTAPAFAADAPKTKAECKKLTDMKWDSTTKACVKK
jgi:hypothetical protein